MIRVDLPRNGKPIALQSTWSKKLRERKDEIENPVIVGDFSISPLAIKICRVRISKTVVGPNNTSNQLVLIDIFRALYSTVAEYILFSSVYKTFTKIDHILSHKK